MGGLLEDFLRGPGVVSEVPGGLPDIDPGSGDARGAGLGPLERRGPPGRGGGWREGTTSSK